MVGRSQVTKGHYMTFMFLERSYTQVHFHLYLLPRTGESHEYKVQRSFLTIL